MSATDFQIPAEFYGGPFCGRKLSIPQVPPPGRTYIARSVTGDAYAYESAERTTPRGRWVLRFVCRVGGPLKGLPAPEPEKERGEG